MPPRVVVAGQRGHLRAVEADADRLPVVQRQPADLGDERAALAADRLDIDRLCESNTSHTVSARRNSAAGVGGGKGKRQAQAVAVAPGLDAGDGGHAVRRRLRRGAAGFAPRPAVVLAGGAIFGAARPRLPALSSAAPSAGLRRLARPLRRGAQASRLGGCGSPHGAAVGRRRLGLDLASWPSPWRSSPTSADARRGSASASLPALLGDRLRRRAAGIAARSAERGAALRCGCAPAAAVAGAHARHPAARASAGGLSACWKATSTM